MIPPILKTGIDGRTLLVLMLLAERLPDVYLTEREQKERQSAIDNVKHCFQNLNFEVMG